MKKITVENAVKLIQSSNGSIFSVSFEKVDGTTRDMVCRTGVSKDIKGVGMSYDPADHGLITVFDMGKQAYRMVRIDTLKRLKMDGQTYNVVQ